MISTLENKVTLVTGADRGIGRAIAMKLGKMGATVIGTGIVEQDAETIKHYLTEEKIKGMGVVLNVCDEVKIAQVIEQIQNEFGAPAILVNNAGITKDNLLMRMKPDQWNDVINTNLNGVFKMTKACIRGMMKAKWGRVISISSVVGLMGNFGQSNYAATKAGIIGFSKSVALEVATYGITVNLVAPGFIDTAMTQKLTESQREALCKMIPMQRIGTIEDIANAVAFLASPDANYITGETLNVNGGMLMG